MRQKVQRSFTIFDALVLMAATAIGMAGMRLSLLMWTWDDFVKPGEGWSVGNTLGTLSRTVWISQSLLAAWCLALLALRLRAPRPRLRELALQPGTVVCVATVLGLTTGLLRVLVRSLSVWIFTGKNWWEDLDVWQIIQHWIIGQQGFIVFGIVLAWTLLAWSKRCRAEPSWVDRTGRILGVLWIAALLASWYLSEAYVVQGGFSPFSPNPAPDPFELGP